MDELFDDSIYESESLEGWVIAKCDKWREHYNSNYETKFEEYYDLWRGRFNPDNRTRGSERSEIVSPALQQAVESSVAEIEEATFGRGDFFTIRDDMRDPDSQDIAYLRKKLNEDFRKHKIRKQVGECLINSAVYGTGIAEIVMDMDTELAPATQPMPDGSMQAFGVNETERMVVKLRPILPQNFLIDPIATTVEDSIGVAIDEYVSPHTIKLLQEQGVYKDVDFGIESYGDSALEADPNLSLEPENKVRITKYYGLVPRYLLDMEADENIEEFEEIEETVEDGIEEIFAEDVDVEVKESYYVEACVVIVNKSTVLKAQENPYMMGDRPVIAFPWDVVPGRFWGRGVCEKGYNSQIALDAELRARIDALALTNAPMIAMDATRMPRGAKPEVRAGKILLTTGDPREVLQPFNFGQVSQITFAQAEALQRMVQTATGAIDSAGVPGSINGEATAAGISMNLGAIIKRHKRTLINFQDSFLIPFVKSAACRYMQFDPENYPINDYIFEVTSTLGIIAREYEVTQLVQLLQTMGQESPMYPILVQSIVDNMQLQNREELMQAIQQASEPNPEAQQAQQQQQQSQLDFQQSQTNALNGQAAESEARAGKIATETKGIPIELENDRLKALAASIKAEGELDKDEFAKRAKMADTLVDEQKLGIEQERLGVEQERVNIENRKMQLNN
tara:strand:+ start:3782 stop:5824 length:2043 start_codon:yes stop_codon:yes gene_type:complete